MENIKNITNIANQVNQINEKYKKCKISRRKKFIIKQYYIMINTGPGRYNTTKNCMIQNK